mgnify:CR=1 FL=1
MGRVIVGVIVGFVVTVILILAGFFASLFGLGLNFILEPDAYVATPTWSVLSLIIGLVCATSGGIACALIARKSIAIKILAAIWLVMGGITAGTAIMSDRFDPGPRPPNEPALAAAGKLSEPRWVTIANPIVGFAGVMIGGRIASRTRKSS